MLEQAAIVVEGRAVGPGGARIVDGVVTIRVTQVLRGDTGVDAGSDLTVAAGPTSVTPVAGNVVWLLEPTDEGLQLVDTWIGAPWTWSTSALGDALRAAFPEQAPPTTT